MPREKKATKKRAVPRPPGTARVIGPKGLVFGPVVREGILAGLRAGATHKMACGLVGIDPRSLKRWLRTGRDGLALLEAWERDGERGDPPELDAYARFTLEVARADAVADFALVASVSKAGQDGEWRASMALLRARRPSEFGVVVGVSATAVGGDDEERRDVTEDLLAKLSRAALRTRGEAPDPEDGDGAGGQ